jgi:hypothetical protein
LLLLATIAADMNENFLSQVSKSTKAEIEELSNRALMKLDMSPDLWLWFDISVGLPLYKTDDAGLSMRLIAPEFEGIAKTEPEFNYALAQVKKRLGTDQVMHSSESCPKCIEDPDSQKKILAHTLTISYEFAYKLERQTNFKWSDEPGEQLGPYLRRLPYLDESKKPISFGLILERATK